jgi:DNA-binding NtrC family response regulator
MDLASSPVLPSEHTPAGEHLICILYVDDDPLLLTVSKTYLERRSDIFVKTASCVRDALLLLKTFDFDVILSDYQMPDIDGIEFLKILQQDGCAIPFILFTGKGTEEIIVEAINNGAAYHVRKGGAPRVLFAELEQKIRDASRRRHDEGALRETPGVLSGGPGLNVPEQRS